MKFRIAMYSLFSVSVLSFGLATIVAHADTNNSNEGSGTVQTSDGPDGTSSTTTVYKTPGADETKGTVIIADGPKTSNITILEGTYVENSSDTNKHRLYIEPDHKGVVSFKDNQNGSVSTIVTKRNDHYTFPGVGRTSDGPNGSVTVNTAGYYTTTTTTINKNEWYKLHHIVNVTNPTNYFVVQGVKSFNYYQSKSFDHHYTFKQTKRVNRPIFEVQNTQIINGKPYYYVKNLNHNIKTYKYGYVEADFKTFNSVSYDVMPPHKQVKTLKAGVKLYHDQFVQSVAGKLKDHQVLTVKRLVKHQEYNVYQLTNGKYIEADKRLINWFK